MASRGHKKREARGAPSPPIPGPAQSPIHAASTSWRAGTTRGVLVGGTHYGRPDGSRGFFLDLVDLDTDALEVARIALPFLAHGLTLDPRNPRRAVVFEKWGPGAALVDLAGRRAVGLILPKLHHHFYGHGAFALSETALFAIETNLKTFEGRITIRDPDSFEIVGELPTYGEKPHDCMLLADGDTLAITNGRRAQRSRSTTKSAARGGSVTFVSIRQQKLLGERPVSDQALNAGHVAIANDGGLAVVSAARDGLDGQRDRGGISLAPSSDGPLATMTEPSDTTRALRGEALSVCIREESDHVVATHPYANLVTVWSLRRPRLLKTLELPAARGVALTLCRSAFVLSAGLDGGLAWLDPETLELGPLRGKGLCSGSHLHTWAHLGT